MSEDAPRRRLGDLDPEFRAVVCKHLIGRARPVDHLCVTAEGTLIAACAAEGHGDADWLTASLGSLIAADAALADVVLAPGEGVERDGPDSPWAAFLIEEEP